MSTEPDDWHADQQEQAPPISKLDAVILRLIRWWGMLFRVLFISLIGTIGYFWLDPQSIGDVPFAALTLNQIVKNIFAFLIPIGCLIWLFKLSKKEDSYELSYDDWGRFGGWVVAIGVLAFFWLSK